MIENDFYGKSPSEIAALASSEDHHVPTGDDSLYGEQVVHSEGGGLSATFAAYTHSPSFPKVTQDEEENDDIVSPIPAAPSVATEEAAEGEGEEAEEEEVEVEDLEAELV